MRNLLFFCLLFISSLTPTFSQNILTFNHPNDVTICASNKNVTITTQFPDSVFKVENYQIEDWVTDGDYKYYWLGGENKLFYNGEKAFLFHSDTLERTFNNRTHPVKTTNRIIADVKEVQIVWSNDGCLVLFNPHCLVVEVLDPEMFNEAPCYTIPVDEMVWEGGQVVCYQYVKDEYGTYFPFVVAYTEKFPNRTNALVCEVDWKPTH